MPKRFSQRVIIAILIGLSALALQLRVARPAQADIPFNAILQTSNPLRSPAAGTVVAIRSETELAALWQSLGRRVAPPQIDFRQHTLIVYFLGERATGGYRLSVESVDVRAGTLNLLVVETEPGPCCVTTQTAISPAIWTTTIPLAWRGRGHSAQGDQGLLFWMTAAKG